MLPFQIARYVRRKAAFTLDIQQLERAMLFNIFCSSDTTEQCFIIMSLRIKSIFSFSYIKQNLNEVNLRIRFFFTCQSHTPQLISLWSGKDMSNLGLTA